MQGGRRFSDAYGTTYATNLRLLPQEMTEEEFVEMMRTRTTNPPMPWVDYSSLHEDDLIASDTYQGSATTAAEYVRESILKPSQYLSEDCPLGACQDFVMPRDFKKRLSAEELDLLVELLTTFE